jgi:hypothetical protein
VNDRAGTEPGFFQRRLPVYAVLGSFFLVTVPLCVLAGGMTSSFSIDRAGFRPSRDDVSYNHHRLKQKNRA